MDSNTRRDYEWARKHEAEAKALAREAINKHIQFKQASHELDTREATDIVIPEIRCALRMRRPRTRWRDLTIRYERMSGSKTEYEKIAEGAGDYYFYGWAAADDSQIGELIVVDLNRMRQPCGNVHEPAKRYIDQWEGFRWNAGGRTRFVYWSRAGLSLNNLLIADVRED